jgi:hypothetical protein
MAALVVSVLLVVGLEAAGTDVDPSDTPPGVTIGATIAQGLGFIGFAVLLARVTSGVALARGVRLRRTRLWPAAGWTLLAWVAFWRSPAPGRPRSASRDDDLPQELGADESTAALVAVILMVTLLAPDRRGAVLPRLPVHGPAPLDRTASRRADHRRRLRRHPRGRHGRRVPRAAHGPRRDPVLPVLEDGLAARARWRCTR